MTNPTFLHPIPISSSSFSPYLAPSNVLNADSTANQVLRALENAAAMSTSTASEMAIANHSNDYYAMEMILQMRNHNNETIESSQLPFLCQPINIQYKIEEPMAYPHTFSDALWSSFQPWSKMPLPSIQYHKMEETGSMGSESNRIVSTPSVPKRARQKPLNHNPNRTRYSMDYKISAIRQASVSSAWKTAKRLQIPYITMRSWQKNAMLCQAANAISPFTSDEQATTTNQNDGLLTENLATDSAEVEVAVEIETDGDNRSTPDLSSADAECSSTDPDVDEPPTLPTSDDPSPVTDVGEDVGTKESAGDIDGQSTETEEPCQLEPALSETESDPVAVSAESRSNSVDHGLQVVRKTRRRRVHGSRRQCRMRKPARVVNGSDKNSDDDVNGSPVMLTPIHTHGIDQSVLTEAELSMSTSELPDTDSEAHVYNSVAANEGVVDDEMTTEVIASTPPSTIDLNETAAFVEETMLNDSDPDDPEYEMEFTKANPSKEPARPRRSDDFKISAIHMAKATSLTKTAKRLEIPITTLQGWANHPKLSAAAKKSAPNEDTIALIEAIKSDPPQQKKRRHSEYRRRDGREKTTSIRRQSNATMNDSDPVVRRSSRFLSASSKNSVKPQENAQETIKPRLRNAPNEQLIEIDDQEVDLMESSASVGFLSPSTPFLTPVTSETGALTSEFDVIAKRIALHLRNIAAKSRTEYLKLKRDLEERITWTEDDIADAINMKRELMP